MNREKLISGFTVILVLAFLGTVLAKEKPKISAGGMPLGESITITTYYPSPYGSYNQLTTAENTYLATDGGGVGIGSNDTLGYKLYVNGTAFSVGGWSNVSDQRLKKGLEKLAGVMEKIKRLEGLKFDWRRDDFKNMNFPEGRQIGMIAQEVEKEFPELVTTNDQGFKSITYDKFSAVLLEALKEQQSQIDNLSARLADLEKKP